MIETNKIISITNDYIEYCQEQNKAPTFSGCGSCLGVSDNTIRHIVKGYYKDGKPYTNKPHPTRRISNNDFYLIKKVFI